MKLFFDTEFTGLHKDTTLISIGIISEDGKTFYAELNDYNKSQVDEWIQSNVIDNLYLKPVDIGQIDMIDEEYTCFNVVGNKEYIKQVLWYCLTQFNDIEIWSDCLAYDWVLFNDIFGHAFNIPDNVCYITFDICNLFEIKGIDPDINREEFINNSVKSKKHNSLYDAKVIKSCYEKLIEM